ncbi:hypothetical protein H5410_024694 [Solanum commersonii]|uniref:Uncharacterized protein n=1 Tax=Solanum commersonii TaxID=4109 RepID=A0A9J5ZMM7_SOLCO|nr:hypothetical protein H5410_024694 [Solanum commersonii]
MEICTRASDPNKTTNPAENSFSDSSPSESASELAFELASESATESVDIESPGSSDSLSLVSESATESVDIESPGSSDSLSLVSVLEVLTKAGKRTGPDQQDRFYRNRSSLPDFVTGTGSYRKFPMVPSGPLVTGLEPVWTGPEPVLIGSFMYR